MWTDGQIGMTSHICVHFMHIVQGTHSNELEKMWKIAVVA
jgi:hypothetical protein